MAELRPIRIGFMPLVDSAILVAAREHGFAAAAGIDLQLKREVSWANIRDRLVMRHFDAAHMLAGQAIAATLGLGQMATPLVAPMGLGLNGNAITVSGTLALRLAAAGLRDGVVDAREAGSALAAVVAHGKAHGLPPLRFGVVFPFSSHNYILRYWLAACGIDPVEDVVLTSVPPPYMAEALASDALDGFCVGEPWNTLAVERANARIIVFGAQVWRGGVEKVLALRADRAAAEPELLADLLRALDAAARWADDPANHPALAETLARAAYLGMPADWILRALRGRLVPQAGGSAVSDPAFLLLHRNAATFPWKSQALWIYSQMRRWGQVRAQPEDLERATSTFRPDLLRAALGEAGALPGASAKVEGALQTPLSIGSNAGRISLGPDRFFDARVFDPDAVEAYLAAFENIRLPVPPDSA